MEDERINLNEWVSSKISQLVFAVRKLLTRDIKAKYETFRYLVLEKIDPTPPPKGKVNPDEWYSQIGYKYALRHARWSYQQWSYANYLYEPLRTPEFFENYSKQSQKILNPLVRVIGLQFYASRQRYQELLDKKE